MALDIFDEIGRIVALCIRIGILSIGQQHYFYIKPFFQEHVYTSQCRVDTGCITIIKHSDVVGETLYQFYLWLSQGGASACHHILNTGLIHGDNVHLPFHQIAQVLASDLLLGLEEPEEFVGLGIDDGVGRIDIFPHVVFLLHDTPRKRHCLARDAKDRKHHAVAKTVVQPAVFALAAYAGTNLGIHVVHNVLLLKTFLFERRHQGRTLLRRVAQLVLADDIIAQSPLAEITEPYCLSLGGVP